MKTVGIISEFNPFHNGHKYLIDTVKQELQADCVVAVMSGNFTQRGELAVFDMYARAEVACQNGVDLVLEIPPQFVLNSAQYYAYYGVYLLHKLGFVHYVCFGSECGELKDLQAVTPLDTATVKERMKSGITYAKAVSDSPLLSEPNNILGVEYLRAMKKLNSHMIPYTVKRKSVAHDAKAPEGNFASASYLRELLKTGGDISPFVPGIPSGNPVFEDCLIDLINYRLISANEMDISGIQNISEGLQNRFLAKRGAKSIRELLDAIKCKRYPETRIRRGLYCLLLNIQKSETLPSYTRVLTFSEVGKKFLKQIKETTSLKLYSRVTKKDISENPQLKKELYCNEIYELAKAMSSKGGSYGIYEHQKDDRRK